MRFELAVAAALLPLTFAAPVLQPRAGQAIPGRYIVKMKNDVLEDLVQEALKYLTDGPKHVYGFGKYKGFAADMADDIVEILAKLPFVDYIEQDAIVKANLGEQIEKRAYVTQASAPWGLARISHKARGSTGYTYDNTGGTGTCSYVIDTGIYTAHSDFGGRATHLANYAGDGTTADGNGHGTHVAGTVGGTKYGVAKATKLYAVKVLNAQGSGSNSGVIAGINFAANDQKTRSCPKGAVANMSLGGSKSTAVNSAAASAVSAGLFLAVAAGNEAQNAANSSPASEPTAFTVGATDSSDRMASFSNFGSVVDIFAPGVSILSTWIGGTTATNTISGTSMASPHVAGLAAYLLSLEGKVSPATLSARLITLSTKSVITGLPSGTQNRLAFNGNPSG